MIAVKLRDIREDADLTQKNLANIIGVASSTYNRWETRECFPPVNRLNDICNYFNVSMDYLMGLAPKGTPVIVNRKLNKDIISSRIKSIRIKEGLTQEQLANCINWGHSTISGYETGKHLVLLTFACDIARKYNVSLDYIYGRSNEKYLQKK